MREMRRWISSEHVDEVEVRMGYVVRYPAKKSPFCFSTMLLLRL
jgi:hypothetical protein